MKSIVWSQIAPLNDGLSGYDYLFATSELSPDKHIILCLMSAMTTQYLHKYLYLYTTYFHLHFLLSTFQSTFVLPVTVFGSCLKTGQHFIFVIIYLLLPIKCIIFDSVSKILFIFLLLPIIIMMILIMKILLHNVHKIINLRYSTYVYQFFNFPYNYKIECWPVFKQDPSFF